MSKILFGTECGTSDTTSGLGSNPANGLAGEILIAQGGRMLMAECTEWMGCENWLTEKAASPAVADAILAGVQHMEGRALASGEDIRGSQPTGDNIAGGLTTIEEKSMGAVKKIGDSPIIEYLEICQAPTKTEAGNYVMYGPGMGAESISSMAAGRLSGVDVLHRRRTYLQPSHHADCQSDRQPSVFRTDARYGRC